MKLSTKIGLGFGGILAITMLLGGLAVWRMNDVQSSSEKLAHAYVPEVAVSNDLERSSLETMYAMRGYGFTENTKYLKTGREGLKKVFAALDEARDLAIEQNLAALTKEEQQARAAVDEYVSLVDETERTFTELEGIRNRLETAAASYMEACAEFLTGQNEALDRDVEERRRKIELAEKVLVNGSSIRVNNFKAQATGDQELLASAIEQFETFAGYFADLREITRMPKDLEAIDQTEASIKGYQETMEAFLAEWKTSGATTGPKMADLRTKMDENAATFATASESFFDAQQQRLVHDVAERKDKITFINDVIDLGNDVRVKTWQSQATRDPSLLELADKNFPLIKAKYKDLREITRLPEDLAKIDQTEKSGDNYRKAMSDLRTVWANLNELNTERGEKGDVVLAAARTTAGVALDNTEKIAEDAAGSLGTATTIVIVGLVVALVVGIAVATFITITISRSIQRTVQGLTDSSNQVASAADQVSSASQQLAEGASEQAAGIEETSSSLEEMSSMTQQNSANAGSANEIMQESMSIVQQAASAMEELTTSMADISQQSEETQKIIKTIDEIAFQTNLLALNAAVEAARAGEAGAGFAVVADEVRSLALRAAEAAKNTADLIDGSVTKIQGGNQILARTNEAFGQVTQTSRKAGELVTEIAAASKEQAQGIDQINQAVTDVDKVTQRNASNAEESAAAAEELNAQAAQMREFVNDFAAMVGSARGAESHLSTPSNRSNGTKPATKRQTSPKKDEGWNDWEDKSQRDTGETVIKG